MSNLHIFGQFCGVLVKICTHARTKKGEKHTGKEESDHFVWEVILDVASPIKIMPGRIGKKIYKHVYFCQFEIRRVFCAC